MRTFIIRLLLVSVSMIAATLQAQNITFNHLTTDDGLSQFSVNSLYIDENGVLWIGTREGLNRYDGEDIQTYKLQKNDPYSLFCNTVLRMAGNRNGKIYLLCTEGVAEFNLATQRFTTLLQGNVHSIYYKEALFIGKQNEIYRYNEQTGNFDLYYQLPGKSLEICCMHLDKGQMWIGTTTDGAYRLQLDKNELTHPILKGNITSIYQDSEGELWIASWEEGLHHVKTDGTIEIFEYDAKNPYSISSNFVRACCEDNLGNIWIGTFNGLNRYDKSTGLFQNHTASDAQSDGLTHSSIWCIVKDNQGTLWLGTYFGGVNYFNPEYEIYSRYMYSPIEKKGLSNPVVGRTIEDKDGNLWIGTEGGGLNYYNRRTREFKWFRPEIGPNSISHNNIKALYYDASKDIIWIGTHLGGLNRLDIRSGRFTHYRMEAGNPETLPSDIIRDIAPYQDHLVIATQNGICLFDPANGKCQQLFQDSKEGKKIKMVADVTFDSNGTLWIAATGEGVFSYRFDTGKLTNYRHDTADPHSISNNNVNNITQDSKGNLWFATSGSGLDLYRPASNDFENFDQAKNGLSSDCIYETQESPTSGKLLLITNEGFSIFDYRQKAFLNYSAENGFPMTAVNENALCVTRDGEIFLGGTQGMISFHEMELNFTPKPYKIILSRLIVNGTEIQVGDETGILQQALYCTPEITLNADQSMFSIEFATSNYVAANKDDIIYKLEGFSNDWNSARGLHNITYTNLNAGTYNLIIKPNGKDESLCPQVHLTIHVLPPYYKTPLAYLIYLIVTGILLWYLVRTYKSRIKLRESLKYEQKHIRDVEALNQSKLRFFTNISHEFRTPLTLIVAQVETLMQLQNFTPAIYNKVLGIYKNSIQLRELITELLDFRKQEQGHMKIKVSPHNIVNFLYENYLLFLEYASAKQISLYFEKETDSLEVWYDQKQMQKVINNLLSNAVKHTKAEDSITLSIKTEGSNAVIRVTDTGSGIDAREVDKIFERFYQIDNDVTKSNFGTGIGLHLSRSLVLLHHGEIFAENREDTSGSRFVIRIPMGAAHLRSDELEAGESSMKIEPVPLKPRVHPEVLSEVPEDLQAEEEKNVKAKINQKVLIVEDEEEIRTYLKNELADEYRIQTCVNGKEAYELMLTDMPDLIISDVMMPEMDGLTLCRKIKQNTNINHIPVVLLTAKSKPEDCLEGMDIGADAYVVKPFNTELLKGTIANLLHNRRMLKNKFSGTQQQEDKIDKLEMQSGDEKLMEKIMKVVNEHLADPDLNAELLATEVGLSRVHIHRKLKELTNLSARDFIKNIRLQQAAKLLAENKKLTISEIAYATGYTSLSHFSNSFKERYGLSPKDYIIKHQKD